MYTKIKKAAANSSRARITGNNMAKTSKKIDWAQGKNG
jgi:hypothetical protein